MTHGRRRRLASVLAAVVVLVVGGSASAAETTIGFEDQPDGTPVGPQYSGLGVQLDPPSMLRATASGLAHAGEQVLRAADKDPITNACRGFAPQVSFSGLFSSPRTTVGIWVRDPDTTDPASHTVSLTTFDAAGAQTGSTDANVTASTDSSLAWSYLLMPVPPGQTIDHFTVAAAGICELIFDDLAFDAPVGAQAPSVAWENPPTQPVAVERGGSATAVATLRRNAGSTGRVALSLLYPRV